MVRLSQVLAAGVGGALATAGIRFRGQLGGLLGGEGPLTADFTFAPDSPVTHDPVTFDAGLSDDPDNEITSFEWAIEGQTFTGSTVSFTFSETGNFVVALTVTNDVGEMATTDKVVPVGNPAPTADFTISPQDPVEEEQVTFDGAPSSDPNGSIVAYEWAIQGGDAQTGQTATATFEEGGNFDVTLTVTDDNGATGSVTQTVAIGEVNDPPTADFTFSPSSPSTADSVQFDGTGSSDPDGSIASYAWDFGDGTTATGATPTHSYTDNGDFTVQLTVTDDDGATHAVSQTITVSNVAPMADFSWSPSNPQPGDEVTFDGTLSADSDGSIASYLWTFHDGSQQTGSTATFTYSSEGDFDVTLEVTDDDGATDSLTQTVGVANDPPTADFTFSPSDPLPGEQVQFDGTLSSDPDGTIESYAWDFGDGATATGPTPTHTYSSSGDFTVTLTVTDDNGATDSTSATVSVNATIDDFERGDLTPYSNLDPARVFVDDTDPAQGSWELHFESSHFIWSMPGDGLSNYPEEGDEFRVWNQLQNGASVGPVFGIGNLNADGAPQDYWYVRQDRANNEVTFIQAVDGTETVLNSFAYSADFSLYQEMRIVWNAGGSFDVALVEDFGNGATLGSMTVDDPRSSPPTTGGFGWINDQLNVNNPTDTDFCRIVA